MPDFDFSSLAGKTAISRPGLSVPTRELIAKGFITSDDSLLNHGRGKAETDANTLANLVRFYSEYDPNYAPNRSVLRRKYDIVMSNYVLNVLPPELRDNAWKDIQRSTGQNGAAFISVRSVGDKTITGEPYADGIITKRGTFQKPYTQESFMEEASRYFTSVEFIKMPSSVSYTVRATGPKTGKTVKMDTIDVDSLKKLRNQPEPEPTSVPPTHEIHSSGDEEFNNIKKRAGIE